MSEPTNEERCGSCVHWFKLDDEWEIEHEMEFQDPSGECRVRKLSMVEHIGKIGERYRITADTFWCEEYEQKGDD